ncbi:MAG: FkbM family methyltransferase [Rhodospirillales bacterium]
MIETAKMRFKEPGGTVVETAIQLDPAQQTQANILRQLRARKFYETHTSQVLVGVLRPGDVFVDVGAHVGYYSLLARALVGPGGRVFAFEPNPETFRMLIANIVGNGYGNVHAFNCALGAKNDVATLHINDDNEGETALWNVTADKRFAKSRAAHRTVQVAVATLDEIAGGGALKDARAVKIDAEGWEPQVLAGAAAVLERDRPRHVVCEINRGALAAAGGSERAIRALFKQRGYGCRLINLSSVDLCGGQPTRPLNDDEFIDTRYVFNLLFSREDGAAG